MSLPPTIYTSQSQLDGTVAGMIVTAVVAALALVMLIGLVYRANSHPAVRRPGVPPPEDAHRPVPAAQPRDVVRGQPASPAPPAAASSPAPGSEPAASWLVGEPHHR
jgi:hypothetical protein